jgi:hypothetical protein
VKDAFNPETPEFEPRPDDLVVTPRPSRFSPWLVPPLLAIVAAVGGLIYRIQTPDWHWSSSKPETVAAVAPKKVPEKPVEPKPKDRKVAKAEAPRTPEPSKPAAVPPPEPAARPETAPKVAQTQDEIEKEAARIRAEREELKRIKEEEGERLAKIPPKPRQEPTLEELHALAFAEMQRMQKEMDLMMDRMRMGREIGPLPPLGPGGFGLPPQIERQIREMERQQEEFFREAEGRMRAQRNAFGFDRPLRALPGGGRRPDVRTFRFSSPDGRIQGFRMRLERNG